MAQLEPEVKQALAQLTAMRGQLVPTKFENPQSPAAPAPQPAAPQAPAPPSRPAPPPPAKTN